MMTKNDYMTSSKAARFLGINIKTLHRWHKIGKFVPDLIFNNYRLYNIKTLNQFKSGEPIERGLMIQSENLQYYQSELERFLQKNGENI